MDYNYNYDIRSLEEYFKGVDVSKHKRVRLSSGEVVVDVPKFIKSHIESIKTYNGKPLCEPYYNRLVKLKKILKNVEKN